MPPHLWQVLRVKLEHGHGLTRGVAPHREHCPVSGHVHKDASRGVLLAIISASTW